MRTLLLGPFLTCLALAQAPTVPPPQGQGQAEPPPPAQEPAAQAPAAPPGPTVLMPRVRDITRVHNTMPHQLVGIGVVAGLAGTGSSDRGTRLAILNFVRDNGLNLAVNEVVGGNTALVSLTASLPAFAKEGQPIFVAVQAIGDATSLRGGALLRAELRGVDGLTYAVAQGAVSVGGYTATGSNASVQKNLSTTGTVGSGLVIRNVESSYFSESGALELRVANPSEFNAASIAAGIRSALGGDAYRVTAVDATLVRIEVPPEQRTNESAVELLVRCGEVRVPVENPARVVVDQASGLVLAGEGVLISPCVVGVTDLTISIVNDEEVVQPNPFGRGDTSRVGRTRIEVQGNSSELRPLSGGATVGDLLQNLRALGLTPGQLASVFVALSRDGYLHAELEVR